MMRRFLAVGGVVAVLCTFHPHSALADLGKNGWCRADRSPRIEVKTATDEVLWDFSKSEKDLNNFSIDTKNPYGKNVITDVGGLMQGGIDMKEGMQYGTITHTRLNHVCYWYNSVTVTLHIKPTIFIASEFPRNTCKHNAIKEHELKHINTDRLIVNKYAGLIGTGLKDMMAKQTLFGPYKVEQAKEVERYMQSRIETILRTYGKMMEDERRQRQQAIDNLDEYERVNRMCR